VFIDLRLEEDFEHPHNAGWMAIFEKWKRQKAVSDAWELSKENYGSRFQWFYDKRLGAGKVAQRISGKTGGPGP
jgi:hypothetical protein